MGMDTVPPSLEYISGVPQSKLIRELQQTEEKGSMLRNGIAPFMISEEATELSGRAMKTALFELLDMRTDDALMFEAYETELFESTRMVVNYESERKASIKAIPESEFWVNFSEQEYDDDPLKQLEIDEKYVEKNLMSMYDLYRKHVDPDAENDDEIEMRLSSNRAINSRVKLPARAAEMQRLRDGQSQT
jgi:hypothetical protein